MKALVTGLALLVVLGLAFLLYRSPTAPPMMTEAEIAQHEAEVMQAIDGQWAGYVEAMLGGDTEGVLSFWTEDMRLWGPGMNLGRRELETLVRDSFGSPMAIRAFDVTPFDTFIHGKVVYQSGQMDVTRPDPDGNPIEDHSYFLAKWVKQPDGAWRMSRGLQGPVEAPEEG
jgi:ketosteroid isomerase-like protein